MNHPLFLLLEDDAERLARFAETVRRFCVPIELVAWRDAGRMIAELPTRLGTAVLISLDHDLEPDPGGPDPGDGLVVAKWLADRPPCCPVIIHTSNTRRGDAMEGELDLAGWTYRRIVPIGDDWIEMDWYLAARKFLRASRGRRH